MRVHVTDSSPSSIRRRQTSTMEIERSQQSPVKAPLDTQTVALIVEVVRPVLREEPNKLLQEGPAGPPVPPGPPGQGADLMRLS